MPKSKAEAAKRVLALNLNEGVPTSVCHRALRWGSFCRSSARHSDRRFRRSRLLPVVNVGLPSVIRPLSGWSARH